MKVYSSQTFNGIYKAEEDPDNKPKSKFEKFLKQARKVGGTSKVEKDDKKK
jgi:hypothetical protein